MKKITTHASLISATIVFLSSPLSASATTLNACPPGQFQTLCQLTALSLGNVLGAVINFIFLLAAIISSIYLLIGGIKWITSEGDTKNVEAARNQIIAAALGLAVTFLSYLIVNLVLQVFIGESIQNVKLENLRIIP